MLKSFEQSTPSADEGAAVAWIAAQLQRQQNAPMAQQKITPVPFWRTMFRIPYLAGAAAMAAVLIFGISLYHGNSDGPGKINPGLGNGNFRSGSIHLVSPIAEQNACLLNSAGTQCKAQQLSSRTERCCGNHAGNSQVIAERVASNTRDESQYVFRQTA